MGLLVHEAEQLCVPSGPSVQPVIFRLMPELVLGLALAPGGRKDTRFASAALLQHAASCSQAPIRAKRGVGLALATLHTLVVS